MVLKQCNKEFCVGTNQYLMRNFIYIINLTIKRKKFFFCWKKDVINDIIKKNKKNIIIVVV